MDSNTKLFAVIGSPIEHSFSPPMHNFWFKEAKLNCKYAAFEIYPKELKKAFAAFKTLGFCAINITLPHKNAAVKFIDVKDASLKAVGSVNTVLFKNGKTYGYNTDCKGFSDDLKDKKIRVKNKIIFLYGAGGASKAAAYALKKDGVKKIYVVNRTFRKAQTLAKKFGLTAVKKERSAEILAFADIVVNASSCGMSKDDVFPFPIGQINKKIVVYDLIYNKSTPFKSFAKKFNLKYFSAEGMRVRQGAAAFKKWAGVYPDVKKADNLLKAFSKQK
jgi:shikimate dehydrogenase